MGKASRQKRERRAATAAAERGLEAPRPMPTPGEMPTTPPPDTTTADTASSDKSTPKIPKTAAEVFANVDGTLQAAESGRSQLHTSRAPDKDVGLRSVVVFGRAVTNALQNLRSVRADFDPWYQPYVEEMRRDPLLRYFYILRSQVLKEGSTGARGGNVSINSYHGARDLARFGPRPPGTVGFVMGDQNGGVGWRVRLPDGTTNTIYFDMPPDIGHTWLSLDDAPAEHLGEPIQDRSAEHLCDLYLAYLRRMVNDARLHFLD